MRRRSLLALTFLVALAGAAGLAARTMSPSGVSAVSWNMDLPGFGGWSAIDVSADGRQFWAVGDRGSITRGSLLREGGQLTGVRSVPPRLIRGENTPSNLMFGLDAEGISLDESGGLVISYERFARVWRHRSWRATPERIDQNADFQDMVHNGSLEAVATLPDGTILTLPELPWGKDGYPVYLYDGSRWTQPFSLERTGFWRAVGADLGPDGKFYLLEREFLGVGFASRIRRFDLSEGSGKLPGQTLYRSPPGRHDNLEGIGMWRDDAGHLRAVLVSDDNFMPFLRSEIVEIVLPD